MINSALPRAEYIERKFSEFIQALKPPAYDTYTYTATSQRCYYIKLTPDKINNWCIVNKEDLADLSIPELVAKYIALKHEKEREYGM